MTDSDPIKRLTLQDALSEGMDNEAMLDCIAQGFPMYSHIDALPGHPKPEEVAKGTAGSMILSCPNCGRDCFRQIVHNIEWEICRKCSTQMEFVLKKDLETRWKPFWDRIDAEQAHD